MLTVTLANYAIVALLGIYLFVKLFSKTPSKILTGIIHGSLGLAGLGMFVFYISFHEGDAPVIPFLLLLIAFFFGAGMLIAKLTGKRFPLTIAIVHVVIAIAGLVLLAELWIR